jgi:hypothetical protein
MRRACFEGTLGALDQLVAIGQAGQRIEVGQLADLVLGVPPVCHVLHDAGIADQLTELVVLGRGLGVDDVHQPIGQHEWNIAGQAPPALQRFRQKRALTASLFLGHHAQQISKRQDRARLQLEHAQGLDGKHGCRSSDAPIEAAHAGQILRPGQAALAQLEFEPGARRPEQVAQAPGQQTPLVGLDEEVGGAGFIGPVDRGVVVESGQHQDRQRGAGSHLTQLSAGLETVHARHQGIEHHDVGLPAGEEFQRTLATRRLGDHETALAQGDRGEQEVDFVVVDQQHTRLVRDVVLGGLAGIEDHAAPAMVSERRDRLPSDTRTASASSKICAIPSLASSSLISRACPSTATHRRDNSSAPTVAEDDFSVCATRRTPEASLASRAWINWGSNRFSEVSKALNTRVSKWLSPVGSSSRKRRMASPSS